MGVPAEKPVDQPPVEIGAIVGSKYRVDRVLGVGGMGVVVAATHVDLEEPRALKFMLPKVSANPDSVARFFREARATARLKSAHVAHIFDIGRLEDGLPFIVMEYLEGLDLRQVLEQRHQLPVVEAVDYAMQALAGLAEAHAVGIVHRDLKPANLFVTTGTDGLPLVKIVDFGVSKLLGSGLGPSTDVTQASAVIGSPHYMSPEQLASARMVDARTDIWSIGVMLYEMLTGKLPFEGPSLTAVTIEVVQTQPDGPSVLQSDVPPELDRVVMKCIAKKPEERYRDAATVATDLAPFASERSRVLAEHIRLVFDAARASGRASIPEIADLDWEKVLAANAEDSAVAPSPDAATGIELAGSVPTESGVSERTDDEPATSPNDEDAVGAGGPRASAEGPDADALEGPAPSPPALGATLPSDDAAERAGTPTAPAPVPGARADRSAPRQRVGQLAALVAVVLVAFVVGMVVVGALTSGSSHSGAETPSVTAAADTSVEHPSLDGPPPAEPSSASAAPDGGQPTPSADAGAADAGKPRATRRTGPGRLPDIYDDDYRPTSKPPPRGKR